MNPAEGPLDSHARFRHYFQLMAFGLILAGLTVVTVLWGAFLWDLLTDQERFKTWIESYGAYAALVFVAAQFVQVVLFCIPGIPKDLLCYIAGLTPMPVVTFLLISTIGRFPGVFLSSLFG